MSYLSSVCVQPVRVDDGAGIKQSLGQPATSFEKDHPTCIQFECGTERHASRELGLEATASRLGPGQDAQQLVACDLPVTGTDSAVAAELQCCPKLWCNRHHENSHKSVAEDDLFQSTQHRAEDPWNMLDGCSVWQSRCEQLSVCCTIQRSADNPLRLRNLVTLSKKLNALFAHVNAPTLHGSDKRVWR